MNLKKDKVWFPYGTKYLRMEQVKFVEDSLEKLSRDWLSRPYCFKSFKGCLPQILLGSFLNTLSHMILRILELVTAEAVVFITLNVSRHFCHRCLSIQDFVIITNTFTIKSAKDLTIRISEESSVPRHYPSISPSIETHLAVVRGLPTKKFLPKCVNKKSPSERRYFVR